MAVNIQTELTTRYDETFLIQLCNRDPDVETLDATATARLAAAIKDCKARLYRHSGRLFEYDGISNSVAGLAYLDWQVDAVCSLVIWKLEAFQLGQTLDADTRYKDWRQEVERDRDRNEVLDPATNATVTEVDPNPPDGDVYPEFNDTAMSDYVPGSRGGGSRDVQ